MSIEQDIVTVLEADVTLSGLIGDRLYPDRLPQNPTYPNIVYSRTSSNPQIVLGGRATRQNCTIQFDVRATSKTTVLSIADALKNAVETGTTYSAVLTNEADFPYESEVETFRRMIDYSIWYT